MYCVILVQQMMWMQYFLISSPSLILKEKPLHQVVLAHITNAIKVQCWLPNFDVLQDCPDAECLYIEQILSRYCVLLLIWAR